MPKQPYSEGAQSVNGNRFSPKEDEQDRILATLDLITPKRAMFALGAGKRTMAALEEAGLLVLGEGKQTYYRRSVIADVMEAMARVRADGREAGDGPTEAG